MRPFSLARLPALAPCLLLAALLCRAENAPPSDPYLWLEAIDDPKSLAWVEQHNAATARRLASPLHDALYRDALAVLDSTSRLPEVTLHGRHVYNLWQDRAHPRGLYRRATLEEFARPAPRWETVLDIDALAQAEHQPWAFGGAQFLPPENRRALIRLAPGGGDAVEVREFDLEKLAFVPGGFVLPVAKSRVAWRDADSLFVGTDFGPGSLTSSGYPRLVKLWRRGTPLAAAETLHTGDAKSMSATARRLRTTPADIDLLTEQPTFWTARTWRLASDGALQPLALPPTARVIDAFRGRLVVWLKEDWTVSTVAAGTPITGPGPKTKTFPAGAVVAIDPAALRAEKIAAGALETIVTPSATEVVNAVNVTERGVLVAMLDHVRGRLHRFAPAAADAAGARGDAGSWTRQTIAFPDHGAIAIASVDDESGDALVRYESFLTPPTLYFLGATDTAPREVKAQAPAFDGSRFAVEQRWTVSDDGTRIPYFVVAPKELKRDGTARVWMFSYGGFENALTPSYSGSYEVLHGAYGKLWLERGGVFVLANIRGGGEFGPQWHRSALKENHVKCFEDFEAVARDLVAQKITSPARLGIEGRSNGGLLVSATMLRHPELYGAVVCGNPLVDMQRYNKLLAGASWMAEYGNPDVPAEWEFLSRYSPYQRVQPGMKLPPILFYTSTRDDRVHPGHARKMAAKMEAQGYAVDYYELTEGGHHGSVTNEQLATRLARTFAFLWQNLK
jgi:prolyl oligopeptidase